MRSPALQNRLVAIDTPGFGGSEDPPGQPAAVAGHARTMPATPDDVALLHDEVASVLRAWRGRGQAYGAVARYDAWAAPRRPARPVLPLSSPDDYGHAELNLAKGLFPSARVAMTAGCKLPPAADPDGVARSVEVFLVADGRP